jgi:hypothetical protein
MDMHPGPLPHLVAIRSGVPSKTLQCSRPVNCLRRYTVVAVELYSKYIMIMHHTINLPIKEGNGLAKHDQHVAVAFQ